MDELNMDELMNLIKDAVQNADFENSRNYVNDGLIDSLDIVEIIALIEEKYQIEINPEDIDPDNFETIEKMWDMISKYKKKSGSNT